MASQSLSDAKVRFAACVSRGVSVLMEENGYSRERAQTALLQELARGDINPPDDEEIFQVMATHGLGIEGSARALTVSKTLQRESTERNLTMMEAIDDLTSKLSVANLIRMDRGSPAPVPPSPSDVAVSIPSRPSKVRIQPVPATRSKPTITTRAFGSNAAATALLGRKSKLASKADKQNLGNAGRKRPVEDISIANNAKKEDPPNNNSFPKRERSDSLSEVVSAKFGERTTDDATNKRSGTPPAVRTKRGRVDEGGASQSALKLARAATDL